MSTPDLQRLIEMAKNVTMSGAHREAQRQSFAYGNAKIENERITKRIVREEAVKMSGESDSRRS